MSDFLDIITWNVRGDLPGDTGDERVKDLAGVFADLKKKQTSLVDFICLQETSGENGALKVELEKAGYRCRVVQEGNGQGDYYVFATAPGSSFTFDDSPRQCLFKYESPSGSPLRYPAEAMLTGRAYDMKVAVFTYHASLDGGLVEGLMKCSEFAVDATESSEFDVVLVAGDLNITEDDQIFDTDLGKDVNFIKRLFKGFAGVSNHLDHILCWPDLGLRRIKGYNYETSSDHNLLYGRFEI